MTTAHEIRYHLLSESPWVNPDRTVDTVKAGDGNRDIRRAEVCWYPSFDTIREAANRDCQLLVCHEPMFWEHSVDELSWRRKGPGVPKQRLLEETNMVVLRVHDTWDQWPEIGIRDSWAAFLGFEKRVYASENHNYHAIYEIPKQPLKAFAQDIANRVGVIGEDSVQVIGDPGKLVCRPAIGVGCVIPNQETIESGADVLIGCYDGAQYWRDRERFFESGAAVITVEHGTCELPGIESLCRYLAQQYPDVTFEYLAEHPLTWTVRGHAT